jgi:LacI family transcriptional regulator
VIPDAARIGYEGAALLDRLMRGEAAPAAMQTIPPQGLAIRQSSDVTAIADPRLADAMRFIREHACDGIGVDDVLDHLAVSRSVLQRLSRKHCDRSILDTITGVRIARVKQLLVETELPLTVIARRAGFAYMEYLSSTFRRQTGWTPSAFRRKFARRDGS